MTLGGAANTFVATMAVLGTLAFGNGAQAFHVEQIVTASGQKGWLAPQQESELIAVELAFEGGTTVDPRGKEGVAELLADLLGEGAGDMDATAFKMRAGHLGTRLAATVNRTALHVRLLTVSEQLMPSLDLLQLMIHRPRLDGDTMERRRTSLARKVEVEAQNPEKVAVRAWFAAAFPDHPVSRTPTRQSVERLTRADVVAHHARMFAKSNLRFVFVGKIDRRDAVLMLDSVARGLPERARIPAVDKAQAHPADNSVFTQLDQPVASAAFGVPALDIGHPDFAALQIVNHILGSGDFDSHLMRELRTKHGLTYSIRSNLIADRDVSVIIGEVTAKNESVASAVASVKEVIRSLARRGPKQEELDRAKGYLKGSFFADFDGSAKAAQTLMGLLLRGKSPEYLDSRAKQLEAVSLQDAKRVAAKVFEPGRLLISVAGKAKPQP